MSIAVWLGALYARRCRASTEDLIGPAYLGLCVAAARFDPSDGRATFATFARQYIRGEILDELGRIGRWRGAHHLYHDLDSRPAEGPDDGRDHAAFWGAWLALPDRDREIVERTLRGESRRQIRAEMRCDPAKIYRRAVARLRSSLGPGDADRPQQSAGENLAETGF